MEVFFEKIASTPFESRAFPLRLNLQLQEDYCVIATLFDGQILPKMQYTALRSPSNV